MTITSNMINIIWDSFGVFFGVQFYVIYLPNCAFDTYVIGLYFAVLMKEIKRIVINLFEHNFNCLPSEIFIFVFLFHITSVRQLCTNVPYGVPTKCYYFII